MQVAHHGQVYRMRPAKLQSHMVEKPWGRRVLPFPFENLESTGAVGEIWYEPSDGPPAPLLVKYIFTSERLSVQVHPNDKEALARGLQNGKTECWYVLECEPDSTIGLGLIEPVDRNRLRSAALDGTIERLIDWKPVRPGDFYFVPAGTVHAIGAGIALVEIQQPSDTTYRLYDYGRPRELHLDDGIEVSNPATYPRYFHRHVDAGSGRLVSSEHFSVFRVEGESPEADALIQRERIVIPLTGSATCGDVRAAPGECLIAPAGRAISQDSGAYLLAVTGRAC